MNYLKKLWRNHHEIIRMKKEVEEKEKIEEEEEKREKIKRKCNQSLFEEIDSAFDNFYKIIKIANSKVFSKIQLGVFYNYEQYQVLLQLKKNMELFLNIVSADHKIFKEECGELKECHHSKWIIRPQSVPEIYLEDYFDDKINQHLSYKDLLTREIAELMGVLKYNIMKSKWAVRTGLGRYSDHSKQNTLLADIYHDLYLLSQIVGISYNLFREHFYTESPNSFIYDPKDMITCV